MTTYYVNSGASGANNGTSWTDAWTSYTSLPSLSSGDIVYFASTHADGPAANSTITLPTSGEGAYFYSVTAGTTTYAAGAEIGPNTSSYGLTLNGSLEAWGMSFRAGQNLYLQPDTNEGMTLHNCVLKPGHQGSIGHAASVSGFGPLLMVNCEISLAADTSGASASILGNTSYATYPFSYPWQIIGGSITNATNRTGANARLLATSRTEIYGMDLSGLSSSCEIAGSNSCGSLVNCKMPASFTVLQSTSNSARVSLYNCLAGAENDRINFDMGMDVGDIYESTTVYLSGGATSDDGGGGTQAFSHVLASNANAHAQSPLFDDWYYVWNDTTGAVYLDIYVGGTEALDDSEVVATFLYMGTSGSEAYSIERVQKTATSSASAHATGGTWSGTVTNAHYIRAAVTVNEKGWIMARVAVIKASLTVYIDPRIVVTAQ